MSTASLLLLGKSRICPTDARTVNPLPRYFSIVLAFAGDSTITSFIFYILERVHRFSINAKKRNETVHETVICSVDRKTASASIWFFLDHLQEWEIVIPGRALD